MTDLLERAFERASRLEPDQQDAIAQWLMMEIDSDRAWDKSFASSEPQLSSMAAEALAEKNAGIALPLEPDEL